MTLPVRTKIKFHFVPPGGSPSAQRGFAPAMRTDSNTKAHALHTPVRTSQSRAFLCPQGWKQGLTLPGRNYPHGPTPFHGLQNYELLCFPMWTGSLAFSMNK